MTESGWLSRHRKSPKWENSQIYLGDNVKMGAFRQSKAGKEYACTSLGPCPVRERTVRALIFTLPVNLGSWLITVP